MTGAGQLPAEMGHLRIVEPAAKRLQVDAHGCSITEREAANKKLRARALQIAGAAQPVLRSAHSLGEVNPGEIAQRLSSPARR